jgi:hypothetical protein
VALAVACLLVGALGGSGWSRQQTQAQADAATRVLLWTDGEQVPGELESGAASTRLRVTLMATGAPVILERVLLGAGQGDSEAGVTLLPGRQATADLVLHADCSAMTHDDRGVVANLSDQRAVVRPAGSRHSREVPLDVLADSSTLMLSLLAPCSTVAQQTAAEAVAAGPTPTPSTSITVAALAATPTGRLTFVLRSRGSAATLFTLPVGTAAGSRARFAVRSRPALPITVRPGATVRVTVDVTATCRSHTGVLPVTYGLLLPQARTVTPGRASGAGAGSALGDVPLEGWDDGVAAAALTAAALHACR